MKMFKHVARLLLSASILALLAAGSAADDKTADHPALMEPVKSVYDHYLKIQTGLTKDSIKALEEHANAIAKAVRDDGMKMLPADVARQAEALARAKDLEAAREAFKPLSKSLIKYLNDKNVPTGTYHEVYCPMADASWLQTGREIRNPYYGTQMLTCGQLKN